MAFLTRTQAVSFPLYSHIRPADYEVETSTLSASWTCNFPYINKWYILIVVPARNIRISDYFLQNTANIIVHPQRISITRFAYLGWCTYTVEGGQEIWRYCAPWHCTGSRYSVGVVIREMLGCHESHLGLRILQYTL